MFMPQGSLRVDGVVTFWSLSEWSRLDVLRDGLTALGYGAFAPEPRTAAAALRDALGSLFRGYLIEPLQGKNKWEVRTIKRGVDENDYPLLHTVELREEAARFQILLSPFHQETVNRLVSAFNDFRGLVRCAGVTSTLTGILASLNGTSLRPRGAIYWLPGSAVATWEAVGKVAEAAGRGQSSKCYLIRHFFDADAVRAVRDAIVAEVGAEVQRIEADVQGGELGERALEHRRGQAVELLDKVALYEQILNESLAPLRDSLDRAETAAGQAALLLSLGQPAA